MKLKIFFAVFIFLLIRLDIGECVPYNVRINNSVRNTISSINPVITWSSDENYSYVNLQISRNRNFSVNYLDTSITTALNFYEIFTPYNDSYYIRLRTSTDGVNYSEWSDSDFTDYFIVDLKFNNIELNFDTFSYKSVLSVDWDFIKPDQRLEQAGYELFLKKFSEQEWRDSGGFIPASNKSGLINFLESGVYNIKIILTDNFGNKSGYVSPNSVIYDASDSVSPEIISVSYTKPLSGTDTVFQFSAYISDSSVMSPASIVLYSGGINGSEIWRYEIFPLDNSFYQISADGLNLSQIDSVYMSVNFFDERGNSVAISDNLPVYDSGRDYKPPEIKLFPVLDGSVIETENFDLSAVAADSSGIKNFKVWINGVLDFDSAIPFRRISLNSTDTGIIKIKIYSLDFFDNEAEAFYYIKKNIPAGYDSNGDQNLIPCLIDNSLSSELVKNNGFLYSKPEFVRLFFNSIISADSVSVILYGEDDYIKLAALQISDTVLECVFSGVNITVCEKYYIKISGENIFNKKFDEEENKIFFNLYGKCSEYSIIDKNGVFIEIPPAAFSEPYWISAEKLTGASVSIAAAYNYDSAVSSLKNVCENIVELEAFSSQSVKLNSPDKPIKIGLKYNDADGNGILDGSNNLNERKLFISYFNQGSGRFVTLDYRQYTDADSNIAYITADHFSIWALSYNGVGSSLSESLKIFPSGRYASISEIQYLTIVLHSAGGNYEFKIFSKNGSKIRGWSAVIPSGNLTDSVRYDLKDSNGKKIKTGTYFLCVKSGVTGEEIIKPFIVVE